MSCSGKAQKIKNKKRERIAMGPYQGLWLLKLDKTKNGVEN